MEQNRDALNPMKINKIDDLTMFDYDIPLQDKRAMDCPRILYLIAVSLHIAIGALSLIGLFQDFSTEGSIGVAL